MFNENLSTRITTFCITEKSELFYSTNSLMDLQRLKSVFETEGATVSLVIQTNQFMVNWLINHISGTDKELGNYLCRTV